MRIGLLQSVKMSVLCRVDCCGLCVFLSNLELEFRVHCWLPWVRVSLMATTEGPLLNLSAVFYWPVLVLRAL